MHGINHVISRHAIHLVNIKQGFIHGIGMHGIDYSVQWHGINLAISGHTINNVIAWQSFNHGKCIHPLCNPFPLARYFSCKLLKENKVSIIPSSGIKPNCINSSYFFPSIISNILLTSNTPCSTASVVPDVTLSFINGTTVLKANSTRIQNTSRTQRHNSNITSISNSQLAVINSNDTLTFHDKLPS